MNLSEFDYGLPKELIARYPLKCRDRCRLMVLDRKRHTIEHRVFTDAAEYFNPEDCLVLNDTKVIPARLFGKRHTGGRVEIFLLQMEPRTVPNPNEALHQSLRDDAGQVSGSRTGARVKSPVCEALVRPSNRLKEGETITLESGDEIEILQRGEIGRYIRFNRPPDELLNETGHVPLPPYIDRADEDTDKSDYQTVYGRKEGATASPTAGLHFTHELLEVVGNRGTAVKYVTLHTSYGTFAPIKSDDVEKHHMHREYFELSGETAKCVTDTKSRGGRVYAVGTTSTRVLEYSADEILSSASTPKDILSGYTDLFIYPGYRFRVIDRIITNFHLPKSTLLLLVSAFAGREFILEAYRKAIEAKYRFYSYGDAMLIL